MNRAWHIATVRGVAVRLHPTLLLIVPWVLWHWSDRSVDPLRGALFGVFVLGAVFASVAGHELAHAIVAHRFGLAVRDITLLPIGGLTRIEQGPLPPRREAAIALAGPAMNLLLALALSPIVLGLVVVRDLTTIEALARLLAETSVTSLLVFTAISNLLLAFLNLIPAFPMDGGRLLRAWLSTLAERSRATRISVGAGYVVAFLSLLLGAWLRDPTLPVAGLFLGIAAFLEQRTLLLERALQRLPVGQFAVWDGGGVHPDEPLAHALQGGPRDVAVVADGIVVGMLWRETVLRHAHVAHLLRAADVMDRSFVAVSPETSVYEAHRRMLAGGHPAVPVVDPGNRYRGVFTSDRLTHVYRYVQAPRRGAAPWVLVARALGLLGR
ncbi:MAG: site-2 protease family protein [Thermomicrobium sp.]|nr:site-2 protease family protein [Thermomicrobium sp.]